MNQELLTISKEKVKETIKRMKSGKAAGPEDTPVEIWMSHTMKVWGKSCWSYLKKRGECQ